MLAAILVESRSQLIKIILPVGRTCARLACENEDTAAYDCYSLAVCKRAEPGYARATQPVWSLA